MAKATASMGKYRLKPNAGSHMSGTGASMRFFKQGDIVESAENLARTMPEKFEDADLPPMVFGPMTPEQKKLKAEELRRMADDLEDSPDIMNDRGEMIDFKTGKPFSDTAEIDNVEPEDDLEGKTVAELHDLAKTEDVDLAGANKKADIVAKIREGRESKA